MPSPLRNPQSLFEWLELDYYRRPRRLRRVRRLIIYLVFLGSLAAIAFTLWPGKPRVYQAGPLSTAHAMFNDNCSVCHTEAFQTMHRLWPPHAEVRSVKDDACNHCHLGAIHNVQQVAMPACASCHQEHRGRQVLANVPGSHCAACHADVQRKDGAPPRVRTVTSFSRDHPEFALFRDNEPTDPGRLYFNHKLHLRDQGVPGPDGKPVTLHCASCHKPDADRRLMQPVNYMQHCAQCHPLGVHIVGPGKDPEALKGVAEFRKEPAPHKEPAIVRAALRDRLTTLLDKYPSLLDGDPLQMTERVRPGRPAATPADKLNESDWVDLQLKKNEQLLFDGGAGCAYCHVRKDFAPGTSRSGALPEFEKTNLPQRWLMHGQFNHDSHRLLDCTACHPAKTSERTADVLLPRLENCRQCHNSQGARSDCVNCHRYHNRDTEGGWTGSMTISDCLGGRK